MKLRSSTFCLFQLVPFYLGIPLASAHPPDDGGLLARAQSEFDILRPPQDIPPPMAELGRTLFWDTRLSANGQIARTGPYFHDGSISNLTEAIQIMADVQLDRQLTPTQATSITLFLESLTGSVPAQFSQP